MAAAVCQHADVCVLLLISVISADISGDTIVFVSRAEHRNVGLLVMVELFIWTAGLLLLYVVHVNDCLSADGPSAGNCTVMWESENDECSYSKLFFISRNAFFSLPVWWNLDVIQRCISHRRPYCTIKHFRRAQMNWSLLLWQYSSISWSCMFW